KRNPASLTRWVPADYDANAGVRSAAQRREMGTTSALLFDPTDPELRRDPYPTYRRMREEAPAWRSPEGVWYFTATRTASTCSEVRHSATTAPRRRRIRAACRRTPSSGPASWQRRAPETLDIARGVNRPLSFGVGHH